MLVPHELGYATCYVWLAYQTFPNRSWKNHLRSCKSENQTTIYQTLCILIDELNVSKFNEIMDQFIKYWGEKEPSFINYFKQYYKNRPGQ